MGETDWKVFDLEVLVEQKSSIGPPYLEFLRVPTLSCGLFTLKAGSTDMQHPHDEDEVYYVVSGRGRVPESTLDRVVRRRQSRQRRWLFAGVSRRNFSRK